MSISLHVNGRLQSFSEEELCNKLERLEELERIFAEKQAMTKTELRIAQESSEEEKFRVIPNSIDVTLFEKKRKDKKQERVRQVILEAFEEVRKRPEKYAEHFYVMIPKKTWITKTIEELVIMANTGESCIADWVHQSLVWAQRIANGESWMNICNNPDTEKWYRIVLGKNGKIWLVGGSHEYDDDICPPADYSECYMIDSCAKVGDAVPLMVFYK